jgi:hypothetical protein
VKLFPNPKLRGDFSIGLSCADTLNIVRPSSSYHPSDDSKSDITVAGFEPVAYSSVTKISFK